MGKGKLRKNRRKQYKYNKRYPNHQKSLSNNAELFATVRPKTTNDFNHGDIQNMDFSTGKGIKLIGSIVLGKKRYISIAEIKKEEAE